MEWAWARPLIGRNDSEEKPSQFDLSPKNLIGTGWLPHGFPCESVVQWSQTLNGDNRSCMAISTKQEARWTERSKDENPHMLMERKSPWTRLEGMETKSHRPPSRLLTEFCSCFKSRICILHHYSVFFSPPFLWLICGKFQYLQLNNACLRNLSKLSINLFKPQFLHL